MQKAIGDEHIETQTQMVEGDENIVTQDTLNKGSKAYLKGLLIVGWRQLQETSAPFHCIFLAFALSSWYTNTLNNSKILQVSF
jgi:hypothetical protein